MPLKHLGHDTHGTREVNKEFHPTGGVKATNYTNTEPEWGKAFFPDAVSGKCTGHT